MLDNTGSMASSNKMTNLKSAAHDLLTTLKNAAKKPGNVQVGNRALRHQRQRRHRLRRRLLDRLDRLGRRQRHLQGRAPWSKSSCKSHGTRIWTPAIATPTWNGCVNDRDQNNDVLNTVPVAGAPATKFRAHQAAACPDRDDPAWL